MQTLCDGERVVHSSRARDSRFTVRLIVLDNLNVVQRYSTAVETPPNQAPTLADTKLCRNLKYGDLLLVLYSYILQRLTTLASKRGAPPSRCKEN